MSTNQLQERKTGHPGRHKRSGGLPGLLPRMEAMGLDDQSLAAKLGKKARTVQGWRLGHTSPGTLRMWSALADELKCGIDELRK